MVSPSTSIDGLLGSYALTKATHDELLSAPGTPRPHWTALLHDLAQLGHVELNRRTDQAQRLLHENGLRYNPYSEPTAGGDAFTTETRPWSVNAVPLVLSADEWRTLSAGLIQRAQLLDAILADLHGPQDFLRRGLIPGELLFGHPGFARCLHGQTPPGGRFLHFYAADLARFADGQWRVIGDRTDSPFGAGYALENRIVISRILPSIFQSAHVERLAPFFLALRDTLRQLSPHHKDNPRIVLLTQGPSGPSYFEDVYLAGYLAYPLVESGDLTVRDNQVFLKTLAGLVPVDVIFRRLSDLLCDPLELKGDASLGVSGLLQTVRAGNVAVVNALGSSLTESLAFWPLFPRLCREIRGDELLLPSLETHWLGDPTSRSHVLSDLSKFVVRSAYRQARQEPFPRERLQRMTPEPLKALVAAQPARFVAQEPTYRSTAPAWSGRGLRPTHVALRVYLVASGDSYVPMPGGLVRAGDDSSALDLSILAGDTSKDAWVLSQGPVRVVSLLQPPGQPVALKRSGAELPSRVADNMFWLGRHVERAESLVRLLRPLLVRLTGEAAGLSERGFNGRSASPDSERVPELAFLLRALADRGQMEPGFVVEEMRRQLPSVGQVLPAAVLDESQPNSLRAIISAMCRVAGLVRDRLSADSWRTVTRLDRDLHRLSKQPHVELHELLAGLNGTLLDLASFAGLVQENTTRTQGWRFLDLGRRLERAQHTINLIRAALIHLPEGDTEDHLVGPVLEVVLEVADSLMTYRSRYLAMLQVAPVLDLVLTDETNPRSLSYQLAVIADHIEQLPRDQTQATRSPEQRIALASLNSVRLADVQQLSEVTQGERRRLEHLLSRLARRLPRLASLIAQKYLIHAGTPRRLFE